MSGATAFSETRFTPEEWHLLVRVPQWVAKAASAAQPDTARRTAAETEAGLVIIAFGRESGNQLVVDIAAHLVATAGGAQEREAAASIDFKDLPAGIAQVLQRVQAAATVLDTKAGAVDAAAYRRWLLAIADVVVKAARTGDVFGLGGQLVTAKEHNFYDRLVELLRA